MAAPQRPAAAAKVRGAESACPQIQWLESHVTDDKLYCVYIAPSADLIRAARCAGWVPANRIAEIRAATNPTTAVGVSLCM